ncbi:hypothetical protein EON64_03680 [archaeon]|nr:MAG: hypothetical protein EON64_03680 [archaeon]
MLYISIILNFDSARLTHQEPLYIPGLTYYEMLHFSAQLRLKGSKVSVEARVQELITLFNLTACKNKVCFINPKSAHFY